MARNPVTSVRPVDPVSAIRRVDSGSTYFRQLDLWRTNSETCAAERRAKVLQTSQADFGRSLSDAANSDTEVKKR